MNATVARIVELLFEDYEMSQEVATIKDEVMTNCQERFNDCVERGLSEDDAIGAVAESLKGMEEVLKEYPRKQSAQASGGFAGGEDGRDEEEKNYTFSPSDIRQINVNLLSEDISFEASPDSQVHVKLQDAWNVETKLRDDCLEIMRLPNDGINVDQMRNMGRVFINGTKYSFSADPMKSNQFSAWFKNFGRNISNSISFGFSESGDITVQLPSGLSPIVHVHTTSGDVNIDGVALSDLLCQTLSGDIYLNLSGQTPLQHVKLQSTSGDIDAVLDTAKLEGNSVSGDMTVNAKADKAILRTTSGEMDVRLNAPEAVISTVSGDITLEGITPDLRINSTSGDIDIRSAVRMLNANTVSGDIEIENGGKQEKMIVGVKTVSGDLCIHAPEHVTASVAMHARSGDVHNHHRDLGEMSDVRVTMDTVSGDVTIY